VATTSLLFDDRFFFGVGTGEALNEHILGHRWPPAPVRLRMLEEAVEIMRALFTGDTVDYDGKIFTVENARLFDPPLMPVPIIVSGFGEASAQLAGRIGDGYWGHSPDQQLMSTFEDAGGQGPRYAQINLCWGEDEAEARRTVHRIWPNGGLSGQLSQDLPTWTHFEDATATVTEEDATQTTPCGPDIAETLSDRVDRFVDSGYTHLYFHQIGPDQRGFFDFWTHELQPTLSGKTEGQARA
jgi:G6PDH family F420-dependent oxidoreductase